MKVIFLDFDGVMCLHDQWGGREKKEMKFLKEFPDTTYEKIPAWIKLDNFDFKATKVLNSILLHYDVEIVVSSDWKLFATLEQLQEMFEYKNGELIYKIKTAKKTNIGDVAGTINKLGYRHIQINRKRYQAHRLVWIYHNIEIPIGLEIDHIDRNPSNNRIENLRLATRSQNMTNKPKQINNTSGYKGVCWHKRSKKWSANIKYNNKQIYLGVFATPELAYDAYTLASGKLQGDFACLEKKTEM